MVRTTPPRPVDLEALFPELVPFRREAVRLHPRPGRPGLRDSSLGGPLLWPRWEPWPRCFDMHEDRLDRGSLSWGQITPEGAPFVPVLQLFADAIPELPFPTEADLLQVLWCPHVHLRSYAPRPQLYWRNSSRCGEDHPQPPHPRNAQPDYLPNPCVVHPERVIDYPRGDMPRELFKSLEDRFDQLCETTGWDYEQHLAESSGVKVGGYPTWTQDPDWPNCPGCDEPMDHLLTINSMEFNGDAWRIWLPLEDRPATDTEMDFRNPTFVDKMSPHGLSLGDGGGIYIFDCRTCPYHPYTYRYDCS
ncbi:DUF1963 domain-containing protein [Nocardia colli]|uniref:DUF1963 domain-containing protein n=1 Tax=Nocardia colli TaxID=2545717 RepID=A0A5N0EIK6_9NOCA|nr:DUF1963 domain-containing protein [Nocardia colli]